VGQALIPEKRAWTHYTELVFLYPIQYAGHTVHSGVSGAGNVDALFFKLRWNLYRFDRKRAGARYAELIFLHPVRPGHETSTHYFS
jgi:hypothetical protein